MSATAALAALHARLMLEIRQHEALAYDANPHALRERVEAREKMTQANALAEVLEAAGVARPDPRQISLFSDGVER